MAQSFINDKGITHPTQDSLKYFIRPIVEHFSKTNEVYEGLWTPPPLTFPTKIYPQFFGKYDPESNGLEDRLYHIFLPVSANQ